MLFASKGPKPQWQLVYDHIRLLPTGGRVTYAELMAITGTDLNTARGALQRAITELQREDLRTMANVRLVGYEVVEAREHAGLARGRIQRSKVQIRKGQRTAKGTDLTRLTPDERKVLDNVSARLDAIEATQRRKDLADQRLVVKTVKRQVSAGIDETVKREVAEQLARLGFTTTAEETG